MPKTNYLKWLINYLFQWVVTFSSTIRIRNTLVGPLDYWDLLKPHSDDMHVRQVDPAQSYLSSYLKCLPYEGFLCFDQLQKVHIDASIVPGQNFERNKKEEICVSVPSLALLLLLPLAPSALALRRCAATWSPRVEAQDSSRSSSSVSSVDILWADTSEGEASNESSSSGGPSTPSAGVIYFS